MCVASAEVLLAAGPLIFLSSVLETWQVGFLSGFYWYASLQLCKLDQSCQSYHVVEMVTQSSETTE